MESFAHSSSLKKKRKKRTIDDFVIFNRAVFIISLPPLTEPHHFLTSRGEKAFDRVMFPASYRADIQSLSLSLSIVDIIFQGSKTLSYFDSKTRKFLLFFYSSSSVLFFESLSSYGSEKMEIKSRLWKWERDIGLLDDRSRYPFPRIRLLSMTRHDCFPSIPDLLFSPGPKCT